MLAGACTARQVPYVDEINNWRATKDDFMRHSEESPVPPEQRAAFPPLSYFPIEPEYRVPAALTVVRGNDEIEIPTSRGERRKHYRVGTLRFTLKGQLLSLTAFVEVEDDGTNRTWPLAAGWYGIQCADVPIFSPARIGVGRRFSRGG